MIEDWKDDPAELVRQADIEGSRVARIEADIHHGLRPAVGYFGEPAPKHLSATTVVCSSIQGGYSSLVFLPERMSDQVVTGWVYSEPGGGR